MASASVRDKITQGMDAFQLALVGLPEERVDEAGACGEWSVKDLVHHVAYWENNEAEELERVLRGEGRPDHGEGEWWLAVNDAVAPTWKNRTYQEARVELTDAHNRLMRVIDGFKAGEEPEVGADTWEHFDEHRADIERWKAESGIA